MYLVDIHIPLLFRRGLRLPDVSRACLVQFLTSVRVFVRVERILMNVTVA